MTELHKGTTGRHIEEHALSLKLIRAGYCWPTMKEDCQEYTQKCDKCQKHGDWIHAPT